MNIDQLKQTVWYKECLDDPFLDEDTFKEAIGYALDPDTQYRIILSNELGMDPDDYVWAIVVMDGVVNDFWMATYLTREQAISVCLDMGWQYDFGE